MGVSATSPGSISTLEMHGTGTSLGDPIEMGAAYTVLQVPSTDALQPLETQAAKSRLLHTEPAAGALGMACLVMRLGQAAGHILPHLRTLNPHVAGLAQGLSKGPQGPKRGWFAARQPACQHEAGSEAHGSVSSFAYQGTNSHAVLCSR